MGAHRKFCVVAVPAMMVLQLFAFVPDSRAWVSYYRDATAANNCGKIVRDRQGQVHVIYQEDLIDWQPWYQNKIRYVNLSTSETNVWETARWPSITCRPSGEAQIVYVGCWMRDSGIWSEVRVGENAWFPLLHLDNDWYPFNNQRRHPSLIVRDGGFTHIGYDYSDFTVGHTGQCELRHMSDDPLEIGPPDWWETVGDPLDMVWGYEGASIALDPLDPENVRHLVYTYSTYPHSIKHRIRRGGWSWPRTVCGDYSLNACLKQRGDELDVVYDWWSDWGVWHSRWNTEFEYWEPRVRVFAESQRAFVDDGYSVWENAQGSRDIHYSKYNPSTNMWEYKGNVSNTPNVESMWPSAFYWHPLRISGAKLDVVWTEGNGSPYTIMHKTINISPVSSHITTIDRGGTCSNGGGRLIRDDAGNLLLAYRSGESVKATFSWDDGDSWSKPVPIGGGHVPCISLNSADEICAIWVDNEDTGSVVQGELLFTKWLVEGWSPIHELFGNEAPAFGVGAPSMAIGAGDTAHVVWLARTQIGAQWADILYYGMFPTDTNTTHPSLALMTIDTVAIGSPPPVPPNEGACASIAIDLLGRPNIAWEKDGEIYHTRLDIGGWTAHENMSSTAVNSSKPCMDSYGLFVHIVWEEEVAAGANEVYHRRKYVSGDTWEPVENISNTPDANSGDPVICAGAHIEWGEYVGSDDDIFASDFDGDSLSWSVATDISETPDTYSGYPQITSTQDKVETWVYTCWVEEDSSSYRILCDKRDPAHAPFGAFNFGQEPPSPITLNRDGIIRYGSKAHEQVDYSNSHLGYRLKHLNPAKKYKFVLTFFQDSKGQWEQKIEIDGWQIEAKSLPRGEKVTVTGWIPPKFYVDGEVDISMRPVGKSMAVCSAVSVYEYGRGKGGPQLAGGSISGVVRDVRLSQIAPNPFSASTVISYSIPERCPVSVRVFDCSGRYVQTLVDKEMPAGQHSVTWDEGVLPSGIYFVRLGALGRRETKKAIILK